eukprot:3280137-Pyramimonas_sp.AAC.1
MEGGRLLRLYRLHALNNEYPRRRVRNRHIVSRSYASKGPGVRAYVSKAPAEEMFRHTMALSVTRSRNLNPTVICIMHVHMKPIKHKCVHGYIHC